MIFVFVFIFGLALGSFLNVVINRLGSEKSALRGRSVCPHCRVLIAWYDNIPLISFIVLGARCRSCHQKISWQYPLVELGTAIALVLLYFRFDIMPTFWGYALFTAFLIIIFVYDLKTYLILDWVSVPAMGIAYIVNMLLGRDVVSLLLGAALGAGFFAAQFFLSRGRWVGDGDIRLGAVMGLMLGWQLLLVALFIAYVVGAAVGVVLLALRRKQASSQVPFGPFLTLATFVTLLYGQELLTWYVNVALL